MMRVAPVSIRDHYVVLAFQNFLSWEMSPASIATYRPCPPAVWAYMLGFTKWCPPFGEL